MSGANAVWRGELVAVKWDRNFRQKDLQHLWSSFFHASWRKHNRLTPEQLNQWIAFLKHEGNEWSESANVACNAGRTVLLDFLQNISGLTGIQYFAVGTGSGTPTANDTQLFTEYYRQAISSYTISGNQLLLTTTFTSAVGNTTYTECGAFGNGATSTANSGTLFAHAPYSFTKTSSEALTNLYTITFT